MQGSFIDVLTYFGMSLRIQSVHTKTIDDATKFAVELDAFNQAERQTITNNGKTRKHK